MVVATLSALAGPAAASPQSEPVRLYVAPWGQDSWPGTEGRPFATPARAQQVVRTKTAQMASDIIVSLRAGTYRLTEPLQLAAGDSGRNGHQVIYQPYGYGTSGQENVTVSGGRRITGWQPRGDGVWQADAGDLRTRQLYVNDRRAERGARDAGLPGKVTRTAAGYETDSALPRSWKRPQDIEFVYTFPFWIQARCGVAEISGSGAGKTAIKMDPECWRLVHDLYEDEDQLGPPTYVENSASFLGKPGTWYLDESVPGSHQLLYVPRQGEDMRGAEVVAPVLETLVKGEGKQDDPLHDVTLRGLTFAHATWLAPSEPAGLIGRWSLYKRPGVPSFLTVPGNLVFHAATRITLEGNRFTHLGAQAIELSKSSSYNVVQGNVITDVSDGGVLLGTPMPDTEGVSRGNRITNNWIHHVGAEYRGASAIWHTAGLDTTLEHNQINDVPYMGILSGRDPEVASGIRRTRIANNRIFHTNLVLNDGGGIYLRGEQGTSHDDGALVSGNAVTDSRQIEFAIGIYTDDASDYVTVRRNVVYNYPASIGGCDEPGRPIHDLRFLGNYWDDAVPDFVPRRDFPGAWPPASDECGTPANLSFTDNTLLNAKDPAGSCQQNPGCAAVLADAGLQSPYRRLLSSR